jgi:hypothetical protein
MQGWPGEVNAFPEYYEQYFKEAMGGGAVAAIVPTVCTGPIRYCGAEALKRDIENLKAAASPVKAHAVFMSSIAPSGTGSNEYYRTEEEFFHAAGAALRTEYQAIIEAGFLLQIDDPFLTDIPSSQISSQIPRVMLQNSAGALRCSSKPLMKAFAGFQKRRYAFIPATVLTRGRASTTRLSIRLFPTC